MACGCLPKDISPIGQDMREICALLWPSADNLPLNRAHFVADPINPALPNS
jgi:hypothetical protein